MGDSFQSWLSVEILHSSKFWGMGSKNIPNWGRCFSSTRVLGIAGLTKQAERVKAKFGRIYFYEEGGGEVGLGVATPRPVGLNYVTCGQPAENNARRFFCHNVQLIQASRIRSKQPEVKPKNQTVKDAAKGKKVMQ